MRKRHKRSTGTIYISPDGGHTVYEQNADGTRGKCVLEDATAKKRNQLLEDEELFGEEAYDLRKKYPTLRKAYNQYKTIFRLVRETNE
jgi:hypothetical protein